ncbi:zinc ribbon domain-containing protein [Streptomyces sp. NPDC058001]|uniref:zinc ribbon domain-containing protein n=1 Tax=Streptomyces sp. NPDC058001 TaxID=3346300 RepID=UPI0036E4841D
MSTHETSRVLVDIDTCVAGAREAERGALWRLAEQGRQLDANLVRLPAGAEVTGHAETELDVLLVVVAGEGRLDNGVESQALKPGAVAWLPRTSHRALVAGPDGLAYLTVHRRRSGLSIGGSSGSAGGAAEGGEAACALDRVCPACGALRAEAGARFCPRCGEEL